MAKEIETYNPKDFAQVMQIIEQRRSQAVQAVNQASLLTAWEVGAFVSDRIKNAQWGAKVVQQLAEYIHTQNPTLKGWSKVTIYRMVSFYDTYTSDAFNGLVERLKLNKQSVPTLSAQIENAGIVSAEMTQIASTSLNQIQESPIVSFEMTQIPSLLMKTGWTNLTNNIKNTIS